MEYSSKRIQVLGSALLRIRVRGHPCSVDVRSVDETTFSALAAYALRLRLPSDTSGMCRACSTASLAATHSPPPTDSTLSHPIEREREERRTRGFAGELNHVLDLQVVVEADAARVALRIQRGRPLALLPREQLVCRPVVRIAVGKVLPPLPLPRALCFWGGGGGRG